MSSNEINSNDLNLIERYLDEELTSEELRSFENRIIEDGNFKDLFEARKELQRLWHKAKRKEATLKEVKQIQENKQWNEKRFFITIPSIIVRYPYYAIAASVVILMGILFIFLFIPQGSKDSKAIVTENNKRYRVHESEKQPFKSKMETHRNENDPLILITPDSGAVLNKGKEILFKWAYRYRIDSVVYLYIISEKDSSIVFSKKFTLNESELKLPIQTLKPGKYVWFVGDQNTMRTFTIQ